MKKTRKNINFSFFQSIILIILCIVSLFSFVSPQIVFNSSAEETYSTVLEDFQNDPNFNIEDYPVVENDYSLQVIQIAESVNNELFIYVYQPSATHVATSINISTAINDSFFPQNYKLILVDKNNSLSKYIVENFIVQDEALRYYSIPSIFRTFDPLIDDVTVEDNQISEVSFAVEKLFIATTINDSVSYTCKDTETVLITSKFVDFIRYPNGFTFSDQACDSHYVAFSTDYDIDRLMEATVSFGYRDVTYKINLTGKHFYSESELFYDTVTLSEIDTAENSAHGLFATKYEWHRIEKVIDFINNEDLTDETKQSLSDKEWILRFYESDYDRLDSLSSFEFVQEVEDVTILRLKFETDGEVYDLGVVDNKQRGDNIPGNNLPNPWDWLLKILAIIFGIIVFVFLFALLCPFLPTILFFIWTCLKAIFKALWWLIKKIAIGIWWVVTAPFEVFND